MTKVLVIDDDRSVRHIVTRGLNGHGGLEVLSAEDGDQGLELMNAENPAVALLDVFLPEYNGLELFRKMRAIDSKMPVIFITGDTSSDTAIEAMRAGAFDYLAKPLNIEQLRHLTLSAVKARRMMDEPVALTVGEGDGGGERFVGRAKRMIEVYKDIGRVAGQAVTVLIRGESGSGKELVARAIVDHSDRRDKPFVAVNCAAIPDQLLESELFGHEKGAFTGAEKRRVGRFEQCDGGTIFLDEVGDMSSATQGKVLRLLQDQAFERVGGNEIIQTNVRVIAATNRPLELLVESEDFREDLLYRLNGFTIYLPPLRERREDIPLLLEYFLRRAKSEMGRPQLEGIAPDALEKLVAYDWPGNVRQLQSAVRQSLLNTTGTVISADNLPGFISGLIPTNSAAGTSPPPSHLTGADGRASNFAGTMPAVETGAANAVSGNTMPTSGPLVSDRAGLGTEQQIPGNGGSDFQQTHADFATVETPAAVSNDASPDVVNDNFLIVDFIEQRLREGSSDLYAEALEQMERRLFAKVLDATGGNQSRAAEILGITRGKVRDRIASFDIQLDRTVSLGKK